MADEHVRVYVSNQLVLDCWGEASSAAACGNATSAAISLKGNTLSEITVEYREMTGEAYCRVYWSSFYFQTELIPQASLCHRNDEAPLSGSPYTLTVMKSKLASLP